MVPYMDGLLKSLIEHGLGWQLVALFLCLLFRDPLKRLLERTSGLKGPGGFELTAPPASAQAVPPPKAPKGEIGSSTTDAAPVTAIAQPAGIEKILTEKREAVLNLGKGNAIVDADVVTIKAQLTALNFPLDSTETTDILLRHLAATQLMVRCERTHRLIFGSQILALQMVKSTEQPENSLMPVFESARAKEPEFYGSYTFGDWIGFLIKEGAVIKTDHGPYAITDYGRSYLDYIAIFASASRPH